MLKTAICHDGPIVVRYPRGNGYGVEMITTANTEIGRGEQLIDGTDLCIIAIGATVQPACMAAEQLMAKGISAGVINARFVKPFDAD